MVGEHNLRSSRGKVRSDPGPVGTPQPSASRTGRRKHEAYREEQDLPANKKLRLQSPELAPSRGGHAASSDNSRAAYGRLDRPAGPHRTNAPLVTPRGSRLVTYPKAVTDASPSKMGLPRPTTTTNHILEEACAHLIRMDPRLKGLIEKHHCHIFSAEGLAEECDPFISLCSSIMAQQVSGAAAASIKNKFVALFQEPARENQGASGQSFPKPNQVAACPVQFLRQAGLSQRKAEYIKGLAEQFASGELSAAMLLNASDEEVMEKLTAVRGLGRWSVEMFACFGLKRMDILSTGDLGVQ